MFYYIENLHLEKPQASLLCYLSSRIYMVYTLSVDVHFTLISDPSVIIILLINSVDQRWPFSRD